MQQFLNELIGEEPTAIVFEDNIGCIFLIKNQKTSSRTKHLAVRHLFGRDLYVDNKVIPAFVRSEENIGDGLTKNQPQQLFAEHEFVMLNGILPYRREDVEEVLRVELSNTEQRSNLKGGSERKHSINPGQELEESDCKERTYQGPNRTNSGQMDRLCELGADSCESEADFPD
jgi:hypothetical protein